MLELKLLGGAVLRAEDGTLPPAATHRHSLALMTLLASAPERTVSRGKLVGLLWPEVAEETARNRLSTTIHRLRKALGDGVIASIGAGLRLDDALVDCDVWRFRAHLDDGNPMAAVDLYKGPFLDGFWLRGSPEFGEWVDRERDRLGRAYRAALESAAEEAAHASEPEIAARYWRVRAREDPYDSRVTLRLMESLDAAGNRAAALRVFSEHAGVLERELGTEPDAATVALAQRLRQRTARAAPTASAAPSADRAERSRPADRRSVAVLPFETVGGSEEARIFAAGLHHDLLTRLSRIDNLKVISRTSVLRYRGGSAPVPTIARELGVGTIVEGGVQHVAGRLRLNVQVIEVDGDTHRWAETYDETLDAGNLFDIQSELAGKIANRLRAELTRHDRLRVARRSGGDLDAYLLYVQGRTHLARRSERGIGRAVEYFGRAIDRDPTYAPAWAGLAGARALQEWYGYLGSAGSIDAMEAARRAVELDPELADSHTALGTVFAGLQDGPAARRAFQRAIELEPNDAEPQVWRGWVDTMLGRPRDGIAPAQRAAELDPMAPYTRAYLGILYLANGRPEDALTEARIARELQPDFEIPYFTEGLALHHLECPAEATFAYEECLALVGAHGAPTRSEVQAALAVTRAAAGDPAAARSLLDDVRAAGDPFAEGLIRAALGEREAALSAFEAVPRWGPFPTALVRYLFPRVLGPLRSDPRFRAVLGRVNGAWGLRPNGVSPSRPTQRRASTPSLAVLPFQEVGDGTARAFADGLHSDLLTRLSRLGGLNVISRTSVLRYRGTDASVPDIAAELGVDAIVEGGVQHANGRIRLNVQLVEGRGDVHQWAETYDRTLTASNLFEIQSELADRLSRSLGQELTPRERERVMDWTPTHDLEAYRLYAHGRARLDERTEEGMRRALELFDDAAARDGEYALAWVGIADSLTLLHEYGFEPADRVLPRAEEAARHALELDPDLAEAHASMGLMFEARREGARAIQALERALELQPGYAEAHNWLSWTSQLLGRPGQALENARRAVALNPLSPEAVSNLAVSTLINGDPQSAVFEARRARELQPTWTTPPFYEALALFDAERFPEAGDVVRDLHVSWADDGAEVTAALVHCMTGDTDLARQLLAGFDDAGNHCATGLLHAALGDQEAALAALGQITDWSYWATLSIHHYYPGVLGTLRQDPRYRVIRERAHRAWGLDLDRPVSRRSRSGTPS